MTAAASPTEREKRRLPTNQARRIRPAVEKTETIRRVVAVRPKILPSPART